MKIGVLSDSHDQLDNLNKCLKYLEKQGVEEAVFCGDFCSPVPIKKCVGQSKIKINAVFGNTEDRHSITMLSLTKIDNLAVHGEMAELEFGSRKVFITHYPDYGRHAAESGRYDAVFFGHTHEMHEEEVGKTLLFNPGEIAGFFEESGFGIYDTETNKVEVVKLKDI